MNMQMSFARGFAVAARLGFFGGSVPNEREKCAVIVALCK